MGRLNMKKCSKCYKKYPLDNFIKNKSCKDGHGNICKNCQNTYSRLWKQKNSKRLAKQRRKRYAETEGLEVKERERKRKKLYPLRYRCQMLRSGMRNRAKTNNFAFDENYFTVNHLIKRLSENPYCECCGKKLDIGFKEDKKFNNNSASMDRVDSSRGYTKDNVAILCWRCNKHKQDSTSKELRIIADFMDAWGGGQSQQQPKK